MTEITSEQQYGFTLKMAELVNLLQDRKSEEVFWARLSYDVNPGLASLHALEMTGDYLSHGEQWERFLAELEKAERRVVLYGAGHCGESYGDCIRRSGMDFYGYVDRKRYGDTFCGKPVLPPEEILEHPEAYFAVITTTLYQKEIRSFLTDGGFPEDQIFSATAFSALTVAGTRPVQYFDFPAFYKKGTAMIDGGSYDGADSAYFAAWCGGNYSKIYAFEPDGKNYLHCKESFEKTGLKNVELIGAGLNDTTGELVFYSGGISSSYTEKSDEVRLAVTRPENVQRILVPVVTIDSCVNTEVGMIKLDIEGAELDALRGAEKTIRRDHPLCAVCVYHRKGDLLAIMNYLHSLVPDYRFYLRHYGPMADETVLYACIAQR